MRMNSIDFNEFKVERNSIPKKIEKFLIISRLAKEKEKSINNAISLFKEYHKKNNSATLTIVGDGEIKDNIKIQIQDLQDSVKMLGARNDIPQIMSEHDVIIALDRCILEAITMKKLAIISGYETLKELITITNVEKASDENFGGKDCTIDELIEQLLNLNENEIKVIVEQNYEFAYRNLNIEKNVYVLEDTSNLNIQFDVKNTMKNIIKLQNIYDEQVNYTDKIYKECKKAEQWYQGQIEARDKQIDELIKERQRVKAKLEKFHLDKVYKIYKKIKSFFKKESVV